MSTVTSTKKKAGFKVGGTYFNREGEYQVLAIDRQRDAVRVRYLADGREDTHPLSLLERIWRNIRRERARAVQEKVRATRQLKKRYSDRFEGLTEEDFQGKVTGTTWRRRGSLAGLVARLLSDWTSMQFQSNAVPRCPMALISHKEWNSASKAPGVPKAKLFLEAGPDGFHYGLYVERNDGAMDEEWDWPRFMAALSREEMASAVEEMEASGARLLARRHPGKEHHRLSDGLERGAEPLWPEEDPSGVPLEERIKLLQEVPPGEWVDLFLVRSVPRKDAISLGFDLVEKVAEGLRPMLPLYEAAARPA